MKPGATESSLNAGTAQADMVATATNCCAGHSAQPASAAVAAEEHTSCCDTPAKRDYFLWFCSLIVAVSYVLGAFVMPHEHHSTVGMFTGGIVELLNQMWWGIAIGVVFVGMLGRVPRDLVMAILGRKGGFGGMLRATSAGVLLDMCSHGILAVAMKLYERGASIGQVMAFLLASPWNSISLTLILFGLIGVGWTLLFIGLSLVIGIVTGLIFDALTRRGHLPANPWQAELGDARPIAQMWSEFRSSIS
ncbi:MAG: permease, partial [Pseudomonadota bacterium]